MKRLLLILGVLGMVLVLSCSWLDWHNDIEYPAEFFMLHETPGDPITFSFAFRFQDQTLDTSGVELKWEKRGSDTLWFSLKGTDGDIDYKGSYRTQIEVNVGVLENGNYTLLFEGEGRDKDTFTFEVEDSLYRFVDTSDSGDVVYHPRVQYDTLRRLFPDMLLVEAAPWNSEQSYLFDTLKAAVLETGAMELDVTPGDYSIFTLNEFHFLSGDVSEGWYDAINTGLIGYAEVLLFTYDGDTLVLDKVFDTYVDSFFPALSIRKGSGFDRYYFKP